MKKLALILALGILVGTAAFSFDLETFPSPIQKGNIMISPTFSFGSYYGFSSAIAITGAVDYALPIPIALTVGGEAGIATVVGYSNNFMSLPIFARVGWHPNFEVPNLDTYITLKLGYNILLSGAKDSGTNWEYNYGGGFSYGGNVGARYFFTPVIGAFAELGYDQYAISYEYKWTGGGPYTHNYNYYIYTWVHVGVTFKF